MMKICSQFNLISSMIEKLETAVFHSESNDILNLCPTIIKTIKVDMNGYVWFFVYKPKQMISEFDKQFPVALNYYKKGEMFFLNVFGIGRIITDPEELAYADIDEDLKFKDANKILICVKVEYANYYNKQFASTYSLLTKWKKNITDLFLPRREYYYQSDYRDDKFFA